MTVAEWLRSRVPPVPGPFRQWMEPGDPDARATVDALAEEARRSLAAVADPVGRPRAGAFDLLAADAFLTYACEAALEADEPEAVDAALRGLVRRFSR